MVPFVGSLEKNDLLEKASYVGYGKLVGPETIVFTSNGSMYTGLMNGQIVRVEPDKTFYKVAQFGDETNETICSFFLNYF